MIRTLTKKWEANKQFLLKRLKEEQQKEDFEYNCTYEYLLKLLIEEVYNRDLGGNSLDLDYKDFDYDDYDTYDANKIVKIDYGQYQGTLILCFPKNTYQPSANETYYTIVEYGSCSGCDALLHVLYLEEGEKKAKLLLELCLHMLQNTHQFKDMFNTEEEE